MPFIFLTCLRHVINLLISHILLYINLPLLSTSCYFIHFPSLSHFRAFDRRLCPTHVVLPFYITKHSLLSVIHIYLCSEFSTHILHHQSSPRSHHACFTLTFFHPLIETHPLTFEPTHNPPKVTNLFPLKKQNLKINPNNHKQ